jgi:hypothetical protein
MVTAHCRRMSESLVESSSVVLGIMLTLPLGAYPSERLFYLSSSSGLENAGNDALQ